MSHDGQPDLKQITVKSKTFDVQYVGGSRITCVNQYLSNPVITLRPCMKCLCVCFIKCRVNLLAGHISTQELYLEDRSVCLFSSTTMPEVTRLVKAGTVLGGNTAAGF